MSDTAEAPTHFDLTVTGMTCAACASRIEKRLNRLDGVTAQVNYATETASVEVDPAIADASSLADVLVGTVEAIGYGAEIRQDHHGRSPAGEGSPDDIGTDAADVPDPHLLALRQRLLVSAALGLPVLLMSMVPALQFDNWQWLALTLTAPVAVWGAWPFHVAAWRNARHRSTTMDTLISIGVSAAFGWSLWALFFGDAGEPGMRMDLTLFPARDASHGAGHGAGHSSDEIYLEVAAAVTVFLLTGRYLEARAKRNAGAALRALMQLGARTASLLRDGREVAVPAEQLVVADRFVVRPGEKVATDGVVVEGTSALDVSMLTGESVPVEVGPGSPATGGTLNVGGRLVVEATRVGSETTLAQLARLLEQAQSGKAPVQRLADRVSAVFVPFVLLLALGTLLAWLVLDGDVESAFTATVAVLIIACPCALGLATPMALMVGTGRGAQMGIVIKGPEVLEATRQVDTVVLDKTGTVTTGEMSLLDVVTAPGEHHADVLQRIGSLEAASEHPVARAIASAAASSSQMLSVHAFENHPGLGVRGQVDGVLVMAGRPSLLMEWGLAMPGELADARSAAEAQGRTVVGGGWDGSIRALFVVADTPKTTSAEAIRRFRDLGLRPVLLTGDHTNTARAVAREVGILGAGSDADDEGAVIAEVLPAEKVAVVQRLQAEGRVVAMVGDGVNDAAALAQADLGIAMGTGTDAAIEASDLTVVSGDLRVAADAVRLSRRTLGTIKGNLFWAFAYNVAALPLAALGYLNPVIAGLAMASSSLFVVTNSLRLRRFR